MKKFLSNNIRYLFVIISLVLTSFSVIGFTNANGIFKAHFAEKLDITISQQTLYSTIVGISSVYISQYLIKLLKYIKINFMFLFAAILNIVSCLFCVLTNNIFFFYFCTLIKSLSLFCMGSVFITLIIGNWFKNDAAFVTSFVMLFTGLGGGFITPIINDILTKKGLLYGYLFSPILTLICVLPFIIFVRKDPKELNLPSFSLNRNKDEVKLISDIKPKFIYIIIFCLSVIGIANIYSFLPLFMSSRGYSSSLGALSLSMCMYGNVTSKICFGLISKKIGLNKSILIMMLIACCGFSGLIFLDLTKILIIIFSFMYGFSHSITSVGLSLYVRQFYPGDDYGKYYSKIVTYDSFFNYVIQFIASLSFDFFSTYVPAFIFCLSCGIVSLLLLIKERKI